MVPCQPRQLVILSLPFAALVAFFWFKRRKSLSRSDPGGTLEPIKPADKPAKIATELVINSGKVVDHCLAKSSSTTEAKVVKKTESPKSIEKVEEPSLSAVVENSVTVEKSDTLCNGTAVLLKDSPKIVSVVCREVNNYHSTSPDFDTNIVFHSTGIEDEKDCVRVAHLEQHKQPVEESVHGSKVRVAESFCSVNHNTLVVGDNLDKNIVIEREICAEVKDLHKNTVTEEESFQNIPPENQSNSENIALKDKVIAEDTSEEITEHPPEASLFNNTALESSLSGKDHSTTSDETTKRSEEVSTDTGIGSQDLSVTEDSSMAQGQKTEEKNQSNATGLEQKLASLGLDTQQPAQRAERDSANHSPAEVMLNSPAISTFSDAHSEGSSDSGKGCSDVVTPPSRTPAGGSSVAGDQVPIVYEFVLPQVIVGRLIGRHGAFLHDIRAKTHTNVFIKRHPETNSLKICAIEGTQPDIDAALKMIRQKFPLRRFPELTLERVTFVKNSCLPISPENLQLHLVDGVNNDVLLSSLITAGHFFLQLPMHMSYQSLYRLACIMNSVYNTQESPPLPDPRPDMVCVAPAHGGWYRAQILSVDEEANTSDIRFLDYGGFLTVDNSLLRQIRGDFLLLPFQAVECALANVIPAGGEEEWSEDAKQFVQLMTTQQTLQAQVYDYTDAGLPLVYLYCTQFYQSPTDPSGYETKVVLLNQELVSRGYAKLIDPSQEDGQTTNTESS